MSSVNDLTIAGIVMTSFSVVVCIFACCYASFDKKNGAVVSEMGGGIMRMGICIVLCIVALVLFVPGVVLLGIGLSQ